MAASQPSFRLFISSPGDVQQERQIAARIIGRLAAEYADRCSVSGYFWEHEPMLATKDFQEQIPPPSTYDAVVCILWSRLGSRLHSKHVREDGTPFSSGTEYEFEDAARSALKSGTPDLLVYFGRREVLFPAEPKEARDQRISQYDALQAFVRRWFQDTEEHALKAAFNTYDHLAHFEELFEAHLHKLLDKRFPAAGRPAATAQTAAATWTQGSPFRGLSCFEESHAPVFFGRTQAIDDVLSAMRTQAANKRAFVLLFGGSGGGKSSLMRAGIIPLLMRPGVIEGIGLWRRAVVRPAETGGDLFDGLARALTAPGALPEVTADGTSVERLAGLLREQPASVAMLVKGGLSQAAHDLEIKQKLTAQPKARLVLGIDQMEELFTIERIGPATRVAFVRALDQLARSEFVFVLATLRSEFFGRCAELPELLALKEGAGQYQLAAPRPAEIAQMIRLPALAAGLRYEEDATGARLDDLLRDAAVKQPGALPLLQFVLEGLFQQREKDGALTFAAYRVLGGLEGALRQRAEAIFAGLPVAMRDAFPRVFRRLVAINEGRDEAFHRLWARWDAFASDPAAKGLLDAFVDARLLSTDRDSDGTALVGVTHEALLAHWPHLCEWLRAEREYFLTRARVEAAAARWREKACHDEYLLPAGKPLAEAAELLSTAELSAEVTTFVERSVALSRTVERRRIRRLQFASLVFFILALLAVVSARQSGLAKQAEEVKRLEAQARLAELFSERGRKALLGGVLGDAAVYLAASLVEKPDVQATRLLLGQALRRLGPPARGCFGHTDRIVAAGFLPERSQVASATVPGGVRAFFTASRDGSIKLWNASSGMLLRSCDANGIPLCDAHLIRNGTTLVSGTADGKVQVWDLATDSADFRSVQAHIGPVNDLCVDGSGTRAATAGSDRRVAVVELAAASTSASTTRILQFDKHDDRINRLVYAASDTLLLTGSLDPCLRAWDARTGRLVARLDAGQATGAVTTLEVSPDGKFVAAGTSEGEVRVWDLGFIVLEDGDFKVLNFDTNFESASSTPTLEPIMLMRADQGMITTLRFSPSGRSLSIGEEGGRLTTWDLQEKRRLWAQAVNTNDGADSVRAPSNDVPTTEDSASPDELSCLMYAPGGRLLVAGHRDGTLRVRFANSGQPIAVFPAHKTAISALAISDDGWLVSGAEDGTVTSRQIREGLLHARLDHGSAIVDASADASGTRIVTGGRDGRAILWDVERGIQLRSFVHNASGEWVLRAELSPNDRLLLTVCGSSAKVWNVGDGACLRSWEVSTPTQRLSDGLWSTTSAELYLAVRSDDPLSPGSDGENDGWFRWRWSDDTVTLRARVSQGAIRRLEAASDGSLLIAHSATTASCWSWIYSTLHGKCRKQLSAPSVSLSPHTVEAAYASIDGLVGIQTFLMDADRITERTASGHRTSLLRYSPDGKTLLAGDQNGDGRLLDTETLELRARLAGHKAGILAGGFSPDGRLILTAGEDGSARLWQVSDGRALAVCEGHDDWILRSAFTGDGTRFFTAGLDGICAVWDLVTEGDSPVTAARQVLANANNGYSGRDDYLALAVSTLQLAVEATQSPAERNCTLASRSFELGRRALLAGRRSVAIEALDDAWRRGLHSTAVTLLAGRLEQTFSGLLWSRSIGTPQGYHARCIQFAHRSPIVYIAGADGTVRAFDLPSGRLRWTTRVCQVRLFSLGLSADDASLFAMGDVDHAIRIDPSDGRILARFAHPGRQLYGLTMTPDGRTVFIGDSSGQVGIWDSERASCIASMTCSSKPIFGLACSVDGTRLLTAAADAVHLWDLADSRSPRLLAAIPAIDTPQNFSEGVEFSQDGKYFCTRGASGTLRLLRSMDGGQVATLSGCLSDPIGGSFSPDGTRYVAGCIDGGIILWDLPSGKLSQKISGDESQSSSLICGWSKDGSTLITSSNSTEGCPCLWDIRRGRLLRRLTSDRGQLVSACVSPTGDSFLTVSSHGMVGHWTFPGTSLPDETPKMGFAIERITLSPDGKRLAVVATDGAALICDPSTMATIASFPGLGRPPVSVSFMNGGNRLVILDERQRLCFLDIDSGRRIASLALGSHDSLSPGPDGQPLAVGLRDGNVGFLDAAGASGAPLLASMAAPWHLCPPAWSADGRRLAGADCYDPVRVFDRTTGIASLITQIGRTHAIEVLGTALSPTGDRLCTWGMDRCARIWEVPSGHPVGALFGHRLPVLDAQFATSGDRLLTLDSDRMARLWDLDPPRLLLELGNTERLIMQAAFSPRGDLFAIADQRGMLSLHDATDGTELWRIPGGSSRAVGLTFSAAGDLLVSALENGSLRILPISKTVEGGTVFDRLGKVFGSDTSARGETE